MKRIAIIVLSSLLLIGAVGCESSTTKTSPNAPNSTEKTGETPTNQTTQNNQNDATSQTRRDQLNSDIRAREQRNNTTGGDADRANSDLAKEVGDKLEANIPNGQLTIKAKEGAVVVSGTVQTQRMS